MTPTAAKHFETGNIEAFASNLFIFLILLGLDDLHLLLFLLLMLLLSSSPLIVWL